MTTGIRSAGIVGLGLIGGSIARDLLARGVRVRGYDRDLARLLTATRADAPRMVLTASLADVVDADCVVIAVPVLSARDVLTRLTPRLSRTRLVIDVGSTKASIVAAAEHLGVGAQFVGCHPMAGDHRSGWKASRVGLFEQAPVYVCPGPGTTDEARDMALEFWASLGARTCVMDAEAHDRLVAWSSHMPHGVAYALAQSLDAAGVARTDLGRGGREMTRVAGSSTQMWTEIAIDNAAEIAPALRDMESRLRELRDRVEQKDAAAVAQWFAQGHDWFAQSE